MVNRAVFIDRDGVINRDVPYCNRPEDFELLPGVAEGIKLLSVHGFKIIVVTNQSAVARGYCTEAVLDTIHSKMKSELAKYGARIDGIYYCPHHPDEKCDCRKPSPKMLLQAAAHADIDLSQSYVIGDSLTDVEMGQKAGCQTCLVAPAGRQVSEKKGPLGKDAPDPTGPDPSLTGAASPSLTGASPSLTGASLMEAAQLIIAHEKR